MPSRDCPPGDQLQAFAFGKISDADAEPIAQHLDHCQRCTETLDGLPDLTDPVMAHVRQPAQPGLYEEDSQCQEAVQRVKQFGHEPSFSAASDMTAASSVAPATPSSFAPLRQLRDYQLLEKLGEGGMGAVYKARHERLDKIVALKVLPAQRMQDAGAVARFQREMRAVGHLEHPNIVRAMDAGEVDGMHFLVMEHVEGIDLSQLVKQLGPLPINAACEMIRQAAIGLEEAREHDMVHRDIKPSNLMLCAAGKRKPPVVKILDMGLALLSDAHSSGARELTTTGQMMGTLDYMAPEQGGDSKKVDIRADIYALGASLYRLLTGQVIYHGEKYQTPVQKMMALAMEPAPAIQSLRAEVPAELAAIVHRMLEKSPEQRYSTPQEVADVLTPFCAGADLAALLAGGCAASALQDKSSIGTEPSLRSGDVATEHGPTPAAHEAILLVQPMDAEHRQDPGPRHVVTKFKPPLVAALVVGGIAALLVAGIVLFWQTPNGSVRIEIKDDRMTAEIDSNGLLVKRGDDKPISLKPGKHAIRVQRDGFEFETDKFILAKGDDVTLKVELLPGEVRIVNGSTILDRRQFPSAATVGAASQLSGNVPTIANQTHPTAGPSPFDALRREDIPPHELAAAGDGDPAKAPQGLVAVFGNSRLRDWQVTAASHFSSDGNHLVTVDHLYTGQARVWDTKSGNLVSTVPHHNSEGSRYLAGIGEKLAYWRPNAAQVIDVANGEKLYSISIPEVHFNGAAFSLDGKWLAMGSADKTIRICDAATGTTVHVWQGHSMRVVNVAFSPDGKYLASTAFENARAPTSGELKLWDFDNGKELHALVGHKLAVHSLAFSPDGRRFAGGDGVGTVHLWDVQSGEKTSETLTTPGGGNGVPALAFSMDSERLFVGRPFGSQIAVLEASTGNVKSVHPAPYGIYMFSVSPDGKQLAAGGYDPDLGH